MRAEVRTEVVEYKQGDAVLEGYLAYDDAVKGKRPSVLIVHEWMGVNPYVKKRAEQLARLGYIAFAADIYGKGVRPKNSDEAAAESKKYKTDRQLMRARVNAGLALLKNHKLADTKRTAAIGYCFGGTTVLELGRSGADVAGIVSFHGGLDSLNPNDAKNIKGKVLALHGGDDPFVPAEQVAAFQDEMRKAGVDWNMVIYGGAVHSFTNPDSGNDNSKGAAYNEKADKRSWEDMRQFFSEIFK
ncbi:MAG: dienelactone hydrolase family protein [Nitrospirae bacterium]|nr:dienelactone hydrolase family protein [Nitrospirota bacterium]